MSAKIPVKSLLRAYLDLQDIVTTDALVVHVIVGIIGITTILVLDKRKPVKLVSSTRRRSYVES